MNPCTASVAPIYPLGIQSFPKIREGGYVYVDKTMYVHRLVTEGSYYFLSRPRRFGKSLLISTLEAYFQGRRELFNGLALEKLEAEWKPRPVLRIDLNSNNFSSQDQLLNLLKNQLDHLEKAHEVELTVEADEIALRFANLIKSAHEKTGRRVAILIDEYDKPLVSNLENIELQDHYRAQLKGFFGNLKSMDDHIAFGFVTGVTRFSKVSIFSDLNNLRDISLSKAYGTICGITEEELESNFAEGINRLASEYGGVGHDKVIEELRRRYDGYMFAIDAKKVYNPFSLINVFTDNRMDDYWFATGTASFLVKRIKAEHWPLSRFNNLVVSSAVLANIDAYRNPVPLIYQTGYLTLKSFDPRTMDYELCFPNEEVRRGFTDSLFEGYVAGALHSEFDVREFRKDVERGDVKSFMLRLKTLLAAIPYEQRIQQERMFQNVLCVVFMMVGLLVRVEYHTSLGSADMVVFTSNYIFLFEFKYGQTPRKALSQIRERRYDENMSLDTREKILIGASYNPSKKSLTYLSERTFNGTPAQTPVSYIP